MPTITYDEIRAKNGNKPFTMENIRGSEADALIAAVNQGIDSHLEACFIRERGDRFIVSSGRINCSISPESLPVVIRRLHEGDEHAESLASTMLTVIGFSEQDMGYGLYEVINGK